jgi:LacI family transcriptional regulator
MLCNTDENPDKFTQYLKTVLQQRVDGVLVAPVSTDSADFAKLAENQVPTVVIDRRVPGWGGDSVYCDSIAASQALTQHLLSLGHTRVAIISGPATTSTAEDRVAGYCLALCKAGLPVDSHLIYRGEYRASSGRSMTRDLLQSGLAPTAIIATNNTIAVGVLEELKNQGMKVPGDIAVVCFDEIPEMERFFPFLTSVTQPAYDMGINATQLLLSRIGASTPMRPRQVVLPTRLILRYSCGRFLKAGKPESDANFTLLPDLSTNQLVKPLEDVDRELLLTCVPGFAGASQGRDGDLGNARPNRERLVKALAFEKPDRLVCLESRRMAGKLVEQVLGHGIHYVPDGLNLAPEEAIEYAQHLGLDAIPCEISWAMGPLTEYAEEDLAVLARRTFPPPALASQLSMLENLLNAAEGSGVGIYARFSSFFEPALGVFPDADPSLSSRLQWLQTGRFEKLMDLLCRHQERVMRAICDRFGRDLCLVSVRDDFLTLPEMVADEKYFQHSLLPRLARMIGPAREHGLPVAFDTLGLEPQALPGLVQIGIGMIRSAETDLDILEPLVREWQAKLVFSTSLSDSLMASVGRNGSDEQIREFCRRLTRQPGFIFCLETNILGEGHESSKTLLDVFRAVQRFGRYA